MPGPNWRLLYAGKFTEDEDPDAAPVANCGPDPARRFTLRRAVQNMFWTYVVGLIFMAYAVQGIDGGNPTPVVLGLRIALVVCIALAYLGISWIADASLPVRTGYLVFFVALTAITASYDGWDWLDYGAYVSMVIVSLIPWRTSRWVLLGWNVAVLLAGLVAWNFGPVVVALIGMFIGIATGMGIESGRLRGHLNRAEQRVSTLAVAAERERIARDLHDILGHSLTAISIKSGLAARLAESDPAAARDQMAEVERIARVALTDVRSTASGLRQVRLATEIASARSVLLAAGIDATAPAALPVFCDGDSELLGYAVREAVTNVVRHAEATRVVITIADRSVIISDDGVGIGGRTGSGSGLDGLRRRFADAGGRFSVASGEDGGTVVRAELGPVPRSEPQPLIASPEGQPA